MVLVAVGIFAVHAAVVLAVILVSVIWGGSDDDGDGGDDGGHGGGGAPSAPPPSTRNVGVARICLAAEREVCARGAEDLARRQAITAEQEAELRSDRGGSHGEVGTLPSGDRRTS